MSAPQQHPFRAVKLTRFAQCHPRILERIDLSKVLEEQDGLYRIWVTVKATGERREVTIKDRKIAINVYRIACANELLTAQGMGSV